jgi:hypothetical protein
MKRYLLILFSIILIYSSISGQDPVKKIYDATYISKPPVIDGILDDDAWKEGVWMGDFIQFEPYNKRTPSQKTEFKILFDDNNLYVAIKAFDTSPDSIVNRLTRRDQSDGDLAGILIDSYHDLRTAFLFGVSSAGVKYDQFWSNDGQNQDPSWDPNWWVKTTINKEGWVAEMKIPFSQVRFKKNSGQVWGLQVGRVLYRKNETDWWQHIPKDAPGQVHLYGEMKGLEKIRPRKIFDITPYTVARAQTYKSVPDNPFLSSGHKFDLNGGLDAKIGVTNNMTMSLSINPDFGQVEADPSVINLTAFETFFKEQRPFFIEGNNITDFNLGIGNGGIGNDNVFYSRRIGRAPQVNPDLKTGWTDDVPQFTNIIGAAKLTGKTQNGWSVGLIEAVTSEEKAKIDTVGGKISKPVEPFTNYFVGRVQKDINSGNTIIGGILTGTYRNMDPSLASILHKDAYTGGIDFTQYFNNKNWMFNLNSAFSLVSGTKDAILNTQESSARYYQRPGINYVKLDSNRTSLLGTGGRMLIQKLNGHWNFAGVVLWKSPGFELNDIGYLRQADQLIPVIFGQYTQWEPKGIYTKYNISVDALALSDFGGEWLAKQFESNFNMTLKNFWNLFAYGSLTTNQFSTSLLRGGPGMKVPGNYSGQAGISTDNRKKVVVNLNAGINGGYQNSSNNFYINLEVDYKPAKFLYISFNPQVNLSKNQLQYVNELTFAGNQRFIFASTDEKTIAASFRVNLNLSPNLTLQYWGQPFIASVRYYDYKYITNPMADRYADRFHIYAANQISGGNGNEYSIFENANNITDYTIAWNDFNYQAFLSNLVIRWEYNPGSSLYLVWSQTRTNKTPLGILDYFDNVSQLFGEKPANVFLIKFSYRFGLR